MKFYFEFNVFSLTVSLKTPVRPSRIALTGRLLKPDPKGRGAKNEISFLALRHFIREFSETRPFGSTREGVRDL